MNAAEDIAEERATCSRCRKPITRYGSDGIWFTDRYDCGNGLHLPAGKPITDSTRVSALRAKLDFWERNLRANEEHYAREGRSVEKIRGELDLIESTRDVMWPRCDACGRTDYVATVSPGSSHRCDACGKPRKITRMDVCERHAWISRETRYRRVEILTEGGPAGEAGCRGGRCRIWPGIDYFTPAVCHAEMVLPWVAAIV